MNIKISGAKLILVGASLAIAGLLTASATEIYAAKKLRHRLNLWSAQDFFENEWPHTVAGRVVLMAPGSRDYNQDIAELVFSRIELQDNFYNRALLRRFLKSLSDEQLLRFLEAYPFAPDSALRPLCLRALNVSDAAFGPDDAYRFVQSKARVFDLLQSIPNSERYTQEFVDKFLIKTRNQELFVATLGSFVSHDKVDWESLSELYWQQLDSWQKRRAIDEIATNLAVNSENLGRIRKFVAARGIDNPAQRVELFIPFFEVSKQKDEYTDLLRGLLQSLNEYRKPADGERGSGLFTDEVGDWSLVGGWMGVLPEEKQMRAAQYLVQLVDEKDPEIAAGLFHWILDENQGLGLQLGDQLLEQPDSTLRKAVLTILVRHSSLPTKFSVDQAFSGAAPRRTYFTHLSEYVFGSGVTEQYERLAGHQYLGTGKTWLPNSRGGAADWAAYIEKYPWHPGTDDAYYQLATLYLAQDDFGHLWPLIHEYFNRELPDRDADPFMSLLVRESLLKDGTAANLSEFHRYGKMLVEYPLASLLKAPPSLRTQYSYAVEWFGKHPQALSMLGMSGHTLDIVRAILARWRVSEFADKFQIAMELLNGRSDSFWFNDSFYAVMYGLDPAAASIREPSFGYSLQAQRIAAAADIAAGAFFERWNDPWLARELRRTYSLWALLHASDGARYLKNSAKRYFVLLKDVDPQSSMSYEVRQKVIFAQQFLRDRS